MKTQQEIEGMAEKRFPTINLPPDKSFYEHNLMQHGFIKGYQAAQEDKSLLNSILRHCDKYTNDADLGREVRKWMSKNL